LIGVDTSRWLLRRLAVATASRAYILFTPTCSHLEKVSSAVCWLVAVSGTTGSCTCEQDWVGVKVMWYQSIHTSSSPTQTTTTTMQLFVFGMQP